jgi:hypothetical protein
VKDVSIVGAVAVAFFVLCGVAAIMLRILATMLVLAGTAQAHDFYSAQCCRGTAQHGDCEPLPPEAVAETSKGYRVDFRSPTQGEVHELVPYGSPNIWDSQDGRYHVCLRPPNPWGTSRIRCFYRMVDS